jgi:type IV pilus assembly protein PilV
MNNLPRHLKPTGLHYESGSVILEALIGILIFSFGILALIGLQAASIKHSTEAQYRTEAALYANELIGQMWISNKTSLATDFGSTAGGATCAGGAKYLAWCNKVMLKTNSATKITTGLPGATAPLVEFNGNRVTITITWRPPGASLGAHQYVAVTQFN